MTVALLVLHQPVVRLLFERGAFTADSTDITALALLFYAPQLPFVAIDQVLIAAFYALQNTRTPVLVGVFTAGLYVVVALALVDEWGMPALVFANTVQNSVHGIILAVLLWRVVDGMVPGVQRPGSQGPGRLWHAVRDAGLSRAALRVGVAAAAMAGVLLALDRAVLTPAAGLPVPVWGLLLVGAGVVSLGVYAGASVAAGRGGRAPRDGNWAAGVAASRRGWSGRSVGSGELPLAYKWSLSALGVMIGTVNTVASANRSPSPVTKASAWPISANSRKGRSKGSRQSGVSGGSVTVTISHQGR